ncbi:MAG: nodulation protein NfeD, partial [Rhodomicrobium sp.]
MHRCLLIRRLLIALLLSFTTCAAAQTHETPQAAPIAVVADVTGVIGPATALYVRKAVTEAESQQAQVLVLRLDTPGGLLISTREIVEAILASPVPVIGYVAPSGAHAASAGTYILYATSIAAMAPGTNIGAATPVQIGGSPRPPDANQPRPNPSGGKKTSKPAPAPAPTLETKATNDAVAWIKSLAELRGRNAEWAEKAVREAEALNARQALEQHVIDLIAPDTVALLRDVNGKKVVIGGTERSLSTQGIKIEHFEPDFLVQALGAIANPNVALILMLIGTFGLIVELMTPGAILPGVLGAISLVLGLSALSELPLAHAGVALVGLGMAFMIAEAFMPTFGILGLGGIIAFAIGAAMLVNTDVPAYRVSYSVIAGMALVSAAFLIILVRYLWRSQRRKPVTGAEQLIGSEARVLNWRDGEGYVWAQGERWHA